MINFSDFFISTSEIILVFAAKPSQLDFFTRVCGYNCLSMFHHGAIIITNIIIIATPTLLAPLPAINQSDENKLEKRGNRTFPALLKGKHFLWVIFYFSYELFGFPINIFLQFNLFFYDKLTFSKISSFHF